MILFTVSRKVLILFVELLNLLDKLIYVESIKFLKLLIPNTCLSKNGIAILRKVVYCSWLAPGVLSTSTCNNNILLWALISWSSKSSNVFSNKVPALLKKSAYVSIFDSISSSVFAR